jgi:UDP-N-acetylglucosamine 3-dehydrogenase
MLCPIDSGSRHGRGLKGGLEGGVSLGKLLKVGVIGLGAMGRNHLRVYAELPDVKLAGIADVNVKLAKSLAERYHTQPFADCKRLLSNELDAVSITVPTSLHHEVALEVARAGVNMLIEKPIAHTLQAAEEIIRVAEENKVKLMVGHIERFNPAVAVVKKEIEGSEVCSIEITRVGPFPPRIKDVGVILDLGTHDIDLVRYITASEFKNVYCLTSRNSGAYEDAAILLGEMESGVLARITINWLTPFKVREVNIATRERFIKASLIDQKVTEYGKYQDNAYLVKELNVPYGEPLKLELEAFISCLSNDSPPPISGREGLRALEIALQCLRASPR